MKGIILAAGEGRRLKPLTLDIPKCLVPYQGRPILEYTLDAFYENGITDLVIVKGYKEEKINYPDIKYVINDRYASTNMVVSLFCAKNELNDDVVISYGDIVYKHQILKTLMESKDDLSIVIDKEWEKLWRQRMPDPLSDAETLKLDTQGYITELGGKPSSMSDIQGQYIGLFKISKKLWPEIFKLYNVLSSETGNTDSIDNMFMTSFLQKLINSNVRAKAILIHGGWIEIDSVSDLDCSIVEPQNAS